MQSDGRDVFVSNPASDSFGLNSLATWTIELLEHNGVFDDTKYSKFARVHIRATLLCFYEVSIVYCFYFSRDTRFFRKFDRFYN